MMHRAWYAGPVGESETSNQKATMATRIRYSQDVRERAVNSFLEHKNKEKPLWDTLRSIAAEFGCSPSTLREWVKQRRHAEKYPVFSCTDNALKIKSLQHEVNELRFENELLKGRMEQSITKVKNKQTARELAYLERQADRERLKRLAVEIQIYLAWYREFGPRAVPDRKSSGRAYLDLDEFKKVIDTHLADGMRKKWVAMLRDKEIVTMPNKRRRPGRRSRFGS